MEIRKLFGQHGAKHAGHARHHHAINEQAQDATEQTPAAAQTQDSGDVISLSPLSKQLSQVSGILDDDASNRSSKVQALKQSVADGSYSVSSKDVASSIISYAADVAPAQ